MRAGVLAVSLALQPAATAAAGSGSGAEVAQELLARATIQRHSGRRAEAHRLVDAGLVLARGAGSTATEARLLTERGLTWRQEFLYLRRGRERSLEALEGALRLAESAEDPALLAEVLDAHGRVLYVGQLYAENPDYEPILVQYRRAQVLARQGGDEGVLVSAQFHEGVTLERLRRPEDALAVYREALGLAERGGHELEESYVQRHIGFLVQESDPDQALRRFRRSLELRERVGFRVGEPFAHIAVGDVLFLKKDFEAAVIHYRAALKLAEELDLPMARFWALVTWGDYERELERPEQARWYYERALGLTKNGGDWGVTVQRVERRLEALDIEGS